MSSSSDRGHSSPSSLQISGQPHDRIHHTNHGVTLGEPNDDSDSIQVSVAQKMLSAVSGSLITSLLVTPLDVVRVRLQSQHNTSPAPSPHIRSGAIPFPTPTAFSNLPPNLGISTCCREVFWVTNNTQYCVATPSISIVTNPTSAPSAAACAAEEAQNKAFTSTLDGLRKIARNEGVSTLWRGLSPTLVMAIPANVIYFAGYDWLRYSKRSPFTRYLNDTYTPLVAGASARVLAATAVGPIEMFRTRMQAVNTTKSRAEVTSDTFQGLRDLVNSRGYRSLWTGLTLTLWRDVPFSAIYWWGYEAVRDQITDARDQRRGRENLSSSHGRDSSRRRSKSRERDDHTTTLIDSFTAGAISGAFASLVTTPFDVGKTRQQVVQQAKAMGEAAAAGQKLPEDLPMPRFLLHIFRTQGVPGLFKGWAARCLKVAPACAIMISTYEIGKKMAGGINDKRRSGDVD